MRECREPCRSGRQLGSLETEAKWRMRLSTCPIWPRGRLSLGICHAVLFFFFFFFPEEARDQDLCVKCPLFLSVVTVSILVNHRGQKTGPWLVPSCNLCSRAGEWKKKRIRNQNSTLMWFQNRDLFIKDHLVSHIKITKCSSLGLEHTSVPLRLLCLPQRVKKYSSFLVPERIVKAVRRFPGSQQMEGFALSPLREYTWSVVS